MNENDVTDKFLVQASEAGWRLFRNNSGVAKIDGRFVRFGLGNVSQAVNKKIKSADYIGVRPVLITPDMVGQTIGQFVSVEFKGTHGKVYPGQYAWMKLINQLGGYAIINNTGEMLP